MNNLSDLTSDFSSSNWFSSVLVQPNINHKSKTVDIEIILYPRKKNVMELGVGFATDGGVHGQIGWTKPWINSRGHSLRSNLYLSAPKQTLEATYRMPLLKNPLNYYYDFAVGWEGEKRMIPIRECLRCQRYVIGIMRVVGNILADFVRDTTVLHKRISLIKPYFFIQLLDLLALDYVVVPLPLGAMCKNYF